MTQLSSTFAKDITYDGWLGLAIPTNKSLTPLILQAHSQNYLSRPIFLLWLGPEGKDGEVSVAAVHIW